MNSIKILVTLCIMVAAMCSMNAGVDSITWLKIKSKVKIKMPDEQNNEFNAQIRYNVKDSLWISFTGFMGIEGARIMVVRDSMRLYSMFNKSIEKYNINEPNSLIVFPLSHLDWQIVLAQMSPQELNSEFKYEANQKRYENHQEGVKRCIYYDTDNRIKKYEILNSTDEVQFSVEYSMYQNQNKGQWAMNRIWKIYEGAKVTYQFEFDYSKIEFNNPQSMPFPNADNE